MSHIALFTHSTETKWKVYSKIEYSLRSREAENLFIFFGNKINVKIKIVFSERRMGTCMDLKANKGLHRNCIGLKIADRFRVFTVKKLDLFPQDLIRWKMSWRRHAKAKNKFFGRQGSVEPEKLFSVHLTNFCHCFSNERQNFYDWKRNPFEKYFKRGVDLAKVIKESSNWIS